MATKKYLVVHPKLSMQNGKGGLTALKQGKEISLEEAAAKSLVASGKIKLVVAKEPPAEKKEPKSKKK